MAETVMVILEPTVALTHQPITELSEQIAVSHSPLTCVSRIDLT